MPRKATYIDPADMVNLEYNEDGTIKIPDGFEIYIKEDPEEVRRERLAEIESELSGMSEPGDAELIELGKAVSLYHQLNEELKYLRNGN